MRGILPFSTLTCVSFVLLCALPFCQAAPAPPTSWASGVEKALLPSSSFVGEDIVSAVDGVKRPVLNVYGAIHYNVKNSKGTYGNVKKWVVDPLDVPALRGIPSAVRSKIGRTIADVKPIEGGYLLSNRGSTPRLFRLGSKEHVYFVRPGTADVVPASEVTRQQIEAASIHKIPNDAEIVFNQ